MRGWGWLLLVPAVAQAADLPYVNFENHPVHAMDLSPDRTLLAVAHTADQRVQFFDLRSGEPVPAGHVRVGVDPVSVRFRSNNELWVANHVSDSVSVVDVPARQVRATLATADEPFDVVFATGRAFVSCSQANRIQVFEPDNLAAAPREIAIDAEDPRALAVSSDGRTVYAAIFESGNATTLMAGGLVNAAVALPNVVSDPRGPYAGQNPPPNAGNSFDPPLNPQATPPAVGLIVRKGPDGRWRDDNTRDWTRFVSGDLASASGRLPGWDLPDRDVAVIDASSLSLRYASGLMNIAMALAVNPASGAVVVVGTDARNEVRFEPKVNGRFVQVQLARVEAGAGRAAAIVDLNPHLDYRSATIAADQRERAIGDPRAVVFSEDGQRGWVAGLGSNNVVPIDSQGRRDGEAIGVGEGPAGLAWDAQRARLYVWNHFEASLSVVDPARGSEIARVPLFNPLPAAIRAGRRFLYDTHRTSGLGQASCASCHVDARMDRLAWDLGDPSQPPARFDQNCGTRLIRACEDFHAMKGPMATQTLQDIIGHEPFHWRGDRAGLEAFNPAFHGLLGDDAPLAPAEMQAFEDFLATIAFPPNPFRNFDNTLPTRLVLDGHVTSGRFSMAGQPLGTGDAVRGLQLYSRNLLDTPFQCASCHTLPTGMAVNGPLMAGVLNVSSGGSIMARGPMGENHLGLVSVDGSTNVSIKTPQLRNLYEKVGFDFSRTQNRAGFGFLHDGSVDTIARFVSARTFSVSSDQEVADLVALMLAFSGSDFGDANPLLSAPAPVSRDAHAAVGAQLTLAGAPPPPRWTEMLALARTGKVDLAVHAGRDGWFFDAMGDRLLPGDGGAAVSPDALRALATAQRPQTWSVVPPGLGRRIGIDRDGDGLGDVAELAQGSDPADENSTTLRATAGLWFNPQRSGHGFDLQYVGTAMAVTWYTYLDDGTPVWYQAVAARANPWRAALRVYKSRTADGVLAEQTVGELELRFADARRAEFRWSLAGGRSGSEAVQPALADSRFAAPERTGIWYDPRDPGWGLSIYTVGSLRTVVAYFYDGAGEPRWSIGVGDNVADAVVPMQALRGFCPDCAVAIPVPGDGGSVTLDFDGARRASASVQVHAQGGSASAWRRGPVAVEPLSEEVLDPARR